MFAEIALIPALGCSLLTQIGEKQAINKEHRILLKRYEIFSREYALYLT